MKNLYLLLLLPAFFAAGQNQTWQVEYNANVTTLSHLPNGHWLVGGAVGGTSWLFSNGYLAETSIDGTYFSNKEINVIDRTNISAVIPLPDGRQVVAGRADGCDFTQGGFIRLQNAIGTPVWTLVSDWQNYFSGVLAVALTAQQDLISITEEKIWLLELETGLVLQEKELPGVTIYDLAYSSDSLGYLLAAGSSIYSMDNDLNLTLRNSISIQGKYYTRVVAAPDNGFFALQNDSYILYRKWNGTGYSLSVLPPAPGFRVHDISSTGEGAILCGLEGNIGRVVRITDTVTTAFYLPAPDLIPQRVRMDPASGRIVVAGIELHGPSPRTWHDITALSSGSQHCWIQSFEPDGSTPHNGVDAALTEMIVHKLPQAEPYNGAPWSLLKWQITGGDFSVRLKNTGTETLHSVHIMTGKYSVFDPGYCPPGNYVNRHLTQLDLAPGEDTLLIFSHLGHGYTEQVLPWKLCFWVTSPNGQTDANHDNDFVCGEFNLISAAHETGTAELTLYPNPAQEVVYLDIPTGQPGLCRIFDATGQLVFEQLPTGNQDVYTLDVKHLYPGFYIVQTGVGTGMFVKI